MLRWQRHLVLVSVLALVMQLLVLPSPVASGQATEPGGGKKPPSPASAATTAPPAQIVPDEYIVVLKPTVASSASVSSAMRGERGLAVSHVFEHVLKGFAARIPPGQLAATQADPRVAYVAPNRAFSIVDARREDEATTSRLKPPPGAADTMAAPANDSFANAAHVGSLPAHFTQSTAEATTEALEPEIPCTLSKNNTVWYDLQVTADTEVTLTTAGSDFDTAVALFTGPAMNALTPVIGGCNDDSGGDLHSQVTFPAVANQLYYVQVSGFAGSSGSLVLDISEVAVSPQVAPVGVRRIAASTDGVHQTLAVKGDGVNVAVIDTGIDLSHPDLQPVQAGPNCINPGAPPQDGSGHGTHVAGTIAARDNTIGVVGVAPLAGLVAVKVLDDAGYGTSASILCGLDWVQQNANTVQIANMSLGGLGTVTPSNPDCTNANDDPMHTAICQTVRAGVTIVVAAGNDHRDSTIFVPAGYEEVVTVSALADYNGQPGGSGQWSCQRSGWDDSLASFSNWGSPVDIAAPGVCIQSTMRGGYAWLSGTSMASPHVAGAAALYKGANPAATPFQVKQALIEAWEPGPIPDDPDTAGAGNPAGYEGILHLPLGSALPPSPDLSLTTVHPGSFTVGTNGTYYLTVANAARSGPTAGTISVADTLPAGLSFVSGSGAGWACSASGQTVTCTSSVPLAPGASSTITLTVGVALAAVPSVINHACVATGGDGNDGNNCTSDLTLVNPVGTPPPLAFGLVSAGNFHTCALTSIGGVLCWGNDGSGQLGDNRRSGPRSTVPVLVSGLGSGTKAVTAGSDFACTLPAAGGVLCWGRNEYGKLGEKSITDHWVPVPVIGLSGTEFSAVSAGVSHTCALTASGTPLCWGFNEFGQLGDNRQSGWESTVPVPVSGLSSGVSSVGVGDEYTCALTTAGGVLCWGTNGVGELGNNSTTDSYVPVAVSGLNGGATAISLGLHHTCALTTSRSVRCWGLNSDGQLGDNRQSGSQSAVPVAVSGLGSDVSAISAGGQHTCALTTAGGVVCWGDNQFGQLGNNATADSPVPVAVSGLNSGVSAITAGLYHTCALMTDGRIQCWGANSQGQLGNTSTTESHVPVAVSGLTRGDLALAVSHSGGFTVGTAGTYNLTITNVSTLGPTSETISVVDTLPAGLSFVSGSGAGWACSASGQVVTCTSSGPLASGASSTITLTVGVAQAAVPSVTNHACVATSGDGNTANNCADDPTSVTNPPPSTVTLTITKSGNGSVTASPPGTPCGVDCQQYASGTRVTLTATAAQGSVFAGWSGAYTSTANPCTITVDVTQSITATFSRLNAGVQVGRLPSGGSVTVPTLVAILTARSTCGPIVQVQFGTSGRPFDNARVTVVAPAVGPVDQTAGFTYRPPPGATSVSLTIQRIVQSGGATVNPIVLRDGCGDWLTFVGGGPDAFRADQP